jgi:hypothetical protein
MAPEDNARPEDLQDLPEGFWEPIREAVERWLSEYGDSDEQPD